MDPTFPHDCARCVFQGTVTVGDDVADVYTCTIEKHEDYPVVVIRFGEKEGESETHGADCLMDATLDREHFQQPELFEQALELLIMSSHSYAKDH